MTEISFHSISRNYIPQIEVLGAGVYLGLIYYDRTAMRWIYQPLQPRSDEPQLAQRDLGQLKSDVVALENSRAGFLKSAQF